MVDRAATTAGKCHSDGRHPTTTAGVAPQLGEAFDRSHRLHHLVGAVLFLEGRPEPLSLRHHLFFGLISSLHAFGVRLSLEMSDVKKGQIDDNSCSRKEHDHLRHGGSS